jgi:putative transposase
MYFRLHTAPIQLNQCRILGSSEFVTQVLDEAEQNVRRQLSGNRLLETADNLIDRYCAEHKVTTDVLRSSSRRQALSELRRKLALKLVHELGLSLAETGRQLGLTTSGVAQILRRNKYF